MGNEICEFLDPEKRCIISRLISMGFINAELFIELDDELMSELFRSLEKQMGREIKIINKCWLRAIRTYLKKYKNEQNELNKTFS
jgi:hypothetical protein